MADKDATADRVAAIEGYEFLASILDNALRQAQTGKGAQRHAKKGEAFEDQKIMEITNRVGLGGPAFQAVKKIYEAKDAAERGDIDIAKQDLLGAINYCAAMVLKIYQDKHSELEHDDGWGANKVGEK